MIAEGIDEDITADTDMASSNQASEAIHHHHVVEKISTTTIRQNDFSSFVGVRLDALKNHFKPPRDFKFPLHVEYGKQRSFIYMLVYSPAKDGAYCKFCTLFGDTTIEKNCSKIERLVKVPVTFWTTACTKFKKHDTKSPLHKYAILKAESFEKVMSGHQASVAEQLNSAIAL